jgi:hypothetical protein
MDLTDIGLGVCGVDSGGSGYGPVEGSCEHGDEPSGSGAMQLVRCSVSQCTVLFR